MPTWESVLTKQRTYEITKLLPETEYTASVNGTYNQPIEVWLTEITMGENGIIETEVNQNNAFYVGDLEYNKLTFTAQNLHTALVIRTLGDLELTTIQLEKGNIATDWTPAPEDVDSAIAGLGQDLSGVETRVTTNSSNIQSNASAITQEVISRTEAEGELREEMSSKLQQAVKGFEFTVSHRNGLNLLRNSVMYNGSVLWDYEDGLTGETNVWSLTKTSKHSITGNGMNEQTVRIDNGESYSLSVDFNKQTLAGTVEVYYIINNEKEYLLQQVDVGEGNVSVYLEDVPSSEITVGVEMTDISTTQPSYISNLMLAKGEAYEWSPAIGEVYTINVLIDESGIKVKNIDGNAYTAMTPYEFAHYYDNEKVFSFDRQIAQVQDILVQGKTFELDGGIKFINDKVTNKVILVNLRGGN